MPSDQFVSANEKDEDITNGADDSRKETSPLLSDQAPYPTHTTVPVNYPPTSSSDLTSSSSCQGTRSWTSKRCRVVALLLVAIITFMAVVMRQAYSPQEQDLHGEGSKAESPQLSDTPQTADLMDADVPPEDIQEAELWTRPRRYSNTFQQGSSGKAKAIYGNASKEEIEAKIERDRQRYLEEMETWKSYVWTPPNHHESLSKIIATLTPEERELRDWIEQLYHDGPAKPIGLQARPDDPSFEEMAWPGNPFPAPPDLPSARQGSDKKWERLRRQAESPGDEGMCARSETLENYSKLHHQMVMGETPGKFIIYHCERDTGCGGMADRILGMTGSFLLALLHNRAWLGEWQSPVPLDVLFDSPRIDWAYSAFDNGATHPALRDPELTSKRHDLDLVNYAIGKLKRLLNTVDWSSPPATGIVENDREALPSPLIDYYSNRGLVFQIFGYPALDQKMQALGLTWDDAYGCLLHYLFKPKRPMLDYVAIHTSLLALPTIFSVGIQVRTGDASMASDEADAMNTVENHQNFFRCARELGETYALPSQRVVYYLVTDSEYLKKDAARVLGDQLLVTDLKPGHVDVSAEHHDAADGVFGALSEAWILTKTDMRVQTKRSGFGKVATFASGLDRTSISLDHHLSSLQLDCRQRRAFTNFASLSRVWSYGRRR